jgi:amino acid transporter, AAT family
MQTGKQPDQEHGLRHQLSRGQMVMVGVGGSISTGLLLGSAAAIQIAGPAVIFSFVLAAFISWTVGMALGELASAHPAAGSFGVYGDLYLNRWAGFIARVGYWAAISFSVGADLVASSTYMAYWFPGIPALAWVIGFSVLLFLVNLRSVGDYGRFEYWFAMIKVVTIAAFIVIGAALLLGGRLPQQYTSQGGFFPKGHWAPLLAMTFALYTFGGLEFVAITSGESKSVKDIGKAMLTTTVTLTLVYVGAIAVLVGVTPWNQTGMTESPFVAIFRTVHLPAASHVMNFIVLTAALSGANAALYVDSRMMFSLARTGWAPARLGKLNHEGSPTVALLVSSFGIVVAMALTQWAPKNAFVYILGGALFGLLLSWLVPLAAHVVFRRKMSPADLESLPVRSPLGYWGSIIGFGLVLFALFHTWKSSQIAFISGLAYLVLLTAAYFAMARYQKKKQPM